MKSVFIDASFWIALRDEHDQNHQVARQIGVQLAGERVPLVTTPLVFAEVHAAFSRSRTRREQVLREFWESRVIRIELTDPHDYAEARALLSRYRDKAYSFCDAVSFVVIRRLAIPHVASFDDHFRQIGGAFEVVEASPRNE